MEKSKPLNPVNILFLALTPLIAVFGTGWYVWRWGFSWFDFAIFAVMYWATGLSITAGYHRYYAHKSYEASKPLQLFYLIFGAAAVENSVLNWASDHRFHHKYVDSEDDPYNILRGGLYAHMGWIFYKDTRSLRARYKIIPDLLKNPLVRWQDRWYLFLVVAISFGLPTLLGLAVGRPGAGLLWGGFLRVVIVHHMTFFINSLAHLYGKRTYSLDNSARDNWMLAPITFGEGYHNFHHKFQADYRNGIRWYQFDAAKWWLWAMRSFGLAENLRSATPFSILKAKLHVQALEAKNRLAALPAPIETREKAYSYLDAMRGRFEAAAARFEQAKVEYRHRSREWTREMRAQWSENLKRYRAEADEARKSWAWMTKTLKSVPHAQGLLTLTALLDILKTKV